jgi:hypothetical protein
MTNSFALPRCILDIAEGTNLTNNPYQFRCPQCYAKKLNVFYSEVVPEVGQCCFRLTCNRHVPPQHKFVCIKHSTFFSHRKSLLRHEKINSCSRSPEESTEFPPQDTPDGSDDSSSTVFQNLPSFSTFLPPNIVDDHFESGLGKNLSVNELAQPGFGSRRLVAQAFDGKASMLEDSELPSISETYVHLLISAFLLTLPKPDQKKSQFD